MAEWSFVGDVRWSCGVQLGGPIIVHCVGLRCALVEWWCCGGAVVESCSCTVGVLQLDGPVIVHGAGLDRLLLVWWCCGELELEWWWGGVSAVCR